MSKSEREPKAAQAVNQRPMTPRARLVWLLVLLVVQCLYFPINRTVQGGLLLDTPLDRFIPLWSIWIIPYLLSLGWWAVCYFWAAFKMEDSLYQAFVISFVTVMLASYVVYILWPTYVVRPLLHGDNLLTKLIATLYKTDRVNNAFPSGHTYNSVLIALFWSRWHPQLRWLWWTLTVVVLLSTLFTRQHNLPDLVGGIMFAWLGFRFGLWISPRRWGRVSLCR